MLRLRYSAAGRTPVTVDVLVDGRRVASTLLDLDPSHGAVTEVALPSTDVRVLRGDRTAVLRVEVASTTVSTGRIRLRG